MDLPFLLARVLHVALGVFWAGTLVFNAAFLLPSIRDAGPEGARVAGGLMRRRFLDIMPVVALVTVVSGLYLYWRVSSGFAPEYMGSGPGIAYGVGSVAAVVAMGFGIGIMRPSMLRAAALTQSAAGLAGAEATQALATAQALRARAGAAGRVVAWLLTAATVTMALARYL
jgi:hypothetical protein